MTSAQGGRASIPYRPDIDGLRAVAVGAVILYHADIAAFGGGYVGVDVFFVISGYLITQLLTRLHAGSGHARLAEFYLRRARRLLPALLVMSLAVALTASVVLLPWDLGRLGKYLAAVPLALTNMVAWRDTSYFDAGVPRVVLLHSWSLSVEEQFYALYPATLIVIGRLLPRHRTAVLAVLACASFAVCLWASQHRPVANFYLPPSRAWEFLLGALVATAGRPLVRNAVVAQALAVAAMIAIGWTVYAYGPDPRFPAWSAVPPCVATALLLVTAGSPTSWVGRFLSLAPLAYTGRISYALYLWHLPILTLFVYYNIEDPSRGQLVGLLGATYLVAAASHAFIEEPIRRRRVLQSTRSFVTGTAAASLVVLVSGLVYWRSGGFPQRFPADVVTLADPPESVATTLPSCKWVYADDRRVGRLCRYGAEPADAPVALVWGDSHGMKLLPDFEKLAQSRHLQLYVADHAACRPLLGVKSRNQNLLKSDDCLLFNREIARAIGSLRPQIVVLSAHWADSNADLTLAPPVDGLAPASKLEWALDNTARTVLAAGSALCVVLDVPTYDYDVPYAMAMARRRGISLDLLRITRAAAVGQFREFEAAARQLQARRHFRIVDPKDALCRSTTCVFAAGDEPYYQDHDHLSEAGASFVEPTVEPCFADDQNAPR